jgi:hypothetical protein
MSGIGWYGDLGNFLVMPTRRKLKTKRRYISPSRRRLSFNMYAKPSEKASAGYYSVKLTDNNIQAEA